MKRPSRDQASLFGYFVPGTDQVSSHAPLCACGECSAPVERFPQPAVVLAEKTPEDWEGEP